MHAYHMAQVLTYRSSQDNTTALLECVRMYISKSNASNAAIDKALLGAASKGNIQSCKLLTPLSSEDGRFRAMASLKLPPR